MKFFRQAALCAAIIGSLTGSALAQGLGSAASISATGTSASVALPLNPATSNYKSVIIAPAAGTSVEVFYALGGASAAASATPGTVAAAGSTPSAALPSGGICLNVSGYTNVAAITGGTAATVRITQINGCTQFAGGSGGGGGSGGSVTQGTTPWVVSGTTAVGSAATTAPNLIGGTIDGTATGNVSIWKVASGIGYINCANCAGTGISVPFGGAIGTVGTPGGLKDPATGFFQPVPGDVTNGQYVNVKASVLPTGAATQTTLASILTNLASPFQAGGAISNTAFGATQSGTWIVQPGNTANTTAWLVTGAGGTFPVTGTFYQATQPASLASGQVASGAYASGALAIGAGTDGWNATEGLKADAAWTSGPGSMVSLLKSIATNVTAAVPVTVNGAANGLTGLTPGVAQTGTIVAANIDNTSQGGVAFGAMNNFGTTPGAVKVPGVNASLFIGTAAPDTNSGNKSGQTQRVVLATDQPSMTNPQPANITQQAGATVVAEPCQTNTKSRATINFTASGLQTTPIVAGVSGKKTYICQIIINNAGADNIAVIGATTGTSCGTGAYGIYGGSTAATGMNLAANSGWTDGSSGYAVNWTTNNNDDICINHSGSTQVSGKIVTVQQ